ncbi:unnamed protein product (macronuclear) [Paramecium tetraurelia]|uniref:Protein kinase domain-containing protein n=1 Tax=Paramecium tetraurelia TaxID=5888 RepID=A0CEQ9_PARTE|nr:uncharacterized protein GSPATT00037715001 [Paramecium tetraurelia]CAK69276.1 unnamed protein product [Paramecium tetraurelia]|eukprot:XP_001436673.1 hypothetical protein (macronuclear) [Paramecium tetraurelia strain d4-2]
MSFPINNQDKESLARSIWPKRKPLKSKWQSKFYLKQLIDHYIHILQSIVRIIDVYDQGTRVYVVQEFCNSGTLFDFMKKKPQYMGDTLQKKVDEALQTLTMDNFDKFFTQNYIKLELQEMRAEYFLNYSYFSIRDDQLQSKFDAIFMDQQKKAKVEYNSKIKQLLNFRDKNYNSDEQWLIYVAEKLKDYTENEFVLYIKEDLAQFKTWS